ncbi:spermidine synthase family protein [Sphingomonas immobilis]|uniref:Spermidine synthase n=1 Tax=Sphingomonas immobilis TaxID=3063997 RepID=A0ABT9A1P4_9SPHN|nr:spermidine synthase [Sphingomonas sp. CA1-15]MDO7843736.1 spermidine synthase [Sphingomonas sp. CA1-15]
MIPRILIDSTQVPGGGEMRLFSRGDDFFISLGREELMTSRMSGSEEALATMTAERVTASAPHFLVGGYGMGFTLRAALGCLPRDARVTVAELVPAVVAWAKGPMAAMTGDSLADPRVAIVEEDVGAVIAGARGAYDAILLDVDNGPDGLTRPGNDRLYSDRGLAAARAALRPGGVLAVWSAGADAKFARRIREAGFRVDEVAVRARQNGKGAKHVIWFGARD